MSVAVRYYSRSGNTKAVADAMAEALGVEAISIDAPGAQLEEPVDVLFIGGALYAYGLDKHLKEYLGTLDAKDAKRAVAFSTSWVSKHAIDLIKRGLANAGIPASEEAFYAKGKPGADQLAKAADFAKSQI